MKKELLLVAGSWVFFRNQELGTTNYERRLKLTPWGAARLRRRKLLKKPERGNMGHILWFHPFQRLRDR
jgi:hypothetical protein